MQTMKSAGKHANDGKSGKTVKDLKCDELFKQRKLAEVNKWTVKSPRKHF